jgi:hypothetical protein
VKVTEKARREVLAETGIDFGRYRSAELTSRLDLWGLGGRVGLDILISAMAGIAVAVAVAFLVGLAELGEASSWMAAVGATAIGSGVATLIWAARFERRAVIEVETVFRLAGEIAHEAASDLEAVAGSLDPVVRGLVVVSAVPMVADVAGRRFLLLAPVVRRVVETVGGRVLDRALPVLPISNRHPGPLAHQIADRLTSSQEGTVRRVGRAAHWGVLPFRWWGVVAAGVGAGTVVLALAFGLQQQ